MLVRSVRSPGVGSMKKMALMLLLLQTTLLLAAADKPNPADFSVKVHVVFSRAVLVGSYQQIEALIDGQRVELTGFSLGYLALGDYSARVSLKVHGPKNVFNNCQRNRRSYMRGRFVWLTYGHVSE